MGKSASMVTESLTGHPKFTGPDLPALGND